MDENLMQTFARQSELINQLLARMAVEPKVQPADAAPGVPAGQQFEIRSSGMGEFSYRPEEDWTFEAWYARYEDMFVLDAAHMDDAAKARFLVRKLDTAAYARFANYILPRVPNALSFAQTVEELKSVFGRNISVFNTRFNCLQLRKRSLEDMVTYAGRVNRACEDFKLANVTVEQFKSLIFVCGLDSSVDADVRAQLMVTLTKKENVTIKELTDEATQIFSVKQDLSLVNGNASNTHAVAKVTHNHTAKYQKEPKYLPSSSSSAPKQKGPNTPCWFCGGQHYVRLCEFKTHKCSRCHKIGHKEGYCSSATQKQDGERKRHTPQQQRPSKSQQIFHVTKIDAPNRRKFIQLSINGAAARLQMDCGSDITIISRSTWKSVGSPPIHATAHAARNASGKAIDLVGELQCTVMINGMQKPCRCFVSDIADLDVIGIEWFEAFGLWDVPINSLCAQVKEATLQQTSPAIQQQQPGVDSSGTNDILTQFADVFSDELGTCTKTEAKLYLKPGARPIYRMKRPVPYAALDAVEAELNRLEQSGVLTKVEFSDWAAPIVAVRKANGSIRICADFSSGLNDALETNRHPMPHPDDIFATLAGGTVFSNLDLSDAYLQIAVHEDSRHLLTVNTHRGLYRYNRLCFGIKASPGIFQETMDAMLAGMDGVISYLDDVIVVGKTADDHNKNLFAVLQRMREWGFNLKAAKCQFMQPELNYLGFIVDARGRRPTPHKVAAIVSMPVPTDVSTLRSFVGMINYYGQFLRKFNELRRPFDKLMAKDAKFVWSDACQRSFEEVKTFLQSDLLLTHYDPNNEILVAADASSHGVGAVILHRFADGTQKAVAHASRTLSPAEQNYGQVEKEALAIVFALKKFHKMLHGRRFHLSTDHKPLLAIFGSRKGIPVHTANRLQRWALQLMAYDFTIDHVASEKLGHADALSRLMSSCKPADEDFVIAAVQLEADVCMQITDAVAHLPVTGEEIAKQTAVDPILRRVLEYTNNGWPTKTVDPNLQKFHRRRDSLTSVSGCLCYCDRIIIPLSLQSRIIKQLHQAHPGIVRMKALARSYVYWPDIDEHIEALVRGCQRCATAAKSPTKCCLSSWPVPSTPWSRVHMDFAGPFQGHTFLLVIDALTKWPEIVLMASTTTSATIKTLRELFARFGSPDCIVSDNGPQLVSAEMRQFLAAEGVLHIRTAPFHPQSNGQAERFVDTMKRALIKAEGEESLHTALHTFLKTYRTTPNAALPDNATPAAMMFGRSIRTTLSMVKETNDNTTMMRNTDMEQQFNRQHGAVQHQPYHESDRVYVYDYTTPNKRHWVPATVIEKCGSVLYIVRTDDNKVWKRHTNQMRRYDGSSTSLDQSPPTQPSSSLPLSTLAKSPARTPTTSTQPVVTRSPAAARSPVSTRSPVARPEPAVPPNVSVAAGRPQRLRRPTKRLEIRPDARSTYDYDDA